MSLTIDSPQAPASVTDTAHSTARGIAHPWLLVAIVAVAFLVRFGGTVALRDLSEGPASEPVGADGVEYDEMGWHVAQGLGYVDDKGQPTSFRAPGFPFFLAGIYAVAGHDYVIPHIAFCVLGALTCLLTCLLARELFSENLALLTGALTAVYFPHVYYCTAYFSESLFAFCLALAVWLFLVGLRRPSGPLLLLSGIALGYAALTRPVALLAAPGLALIALWAEVRAGRWNLVRPVLFGLGVLAAVIPWTVRNKQVHGEWVLIATNGGSTFYGSNNDIVLRDRRELGYWVTTRRLPGRELVDATPNEVAHDKAEWALGKQWVRENWKSMPLLSLYKLARLWLPDFHSGNRTFVLMNIVGYTPFLLLMIVGAVHCWRNRLTYSSPAWWAVHSALLATTVVNALIFYGCGRFLNAAAPLLMVYAALGLAALFAPGRVVRAA